MFGKRRRVVIGLVAMLVFVLLITGTVGARWVRLGDEVYLSNLIVCNTGIQISIALAWVNPDEASDDDTPPPPPPPNPNFPPQEFEVFVYQGSFRSGRVLASGRVTIETQPVLLTGLPPAYVPSSIRFAPTATYTYGSTYILWDNLSDISIGEEVNVWAVGIRTMPLYYNRPVRIADCSTKTPGFFMADNRLNRAQRDLGATAAIFCEDNSVKVYGINAESQGFFAFSVTQDEIDALGQPPTNTLLDSVPSPFGGDIRLYLLTTGELQLNAPGLPPESWKEYVFTWAGCKT